MILALGSLVAFLLLAALHWASQQLWHGEMRLLWRYTAGTAGIGLVFGVWSLCQAGRLLPAWQCFIAWAAIALGGGLGTLVGHGIDHWAARERELRVLRHQVQREP